MYAGIDLGGTAIKGGVIDARGRVRAYEEVPTPRGVRAVVAAMAALARRLGGRSLGVGVPGPLDAAREVIDTAPNLPGWRRVPIARLLRDAIGRRVVVENDANAAAVGEFVDGAGRGARSMVMYTLGTGVGGGIILDGRLRRGGGELGHVTVNTDGARCPCGSRGCLERYIAAPALQRRFGAAPLKTLLLRPRVAGEVALRLGAAIASIAHALQPDIFVVGGGMAGSAARFLPRTRTIARARVFASYRPGLRIVPARLGNHAGWRGAARLAYDAGLRA